MVKFKEMNENVKYQVGKLHRSAFILNIIILGDLLLTLFSETQRHTFYIVAACYFLQFLFILANFIMLLLLFTNTYAFKAGVVKVMLSEFKGTLLIYCAYLTIFLVTRGMGGVCLNSYSFHI